MPYLPRLTKFTIHVGNGSLAVPISIIFAPITGKPAHHNDSVNLFSRWNVR